jgi:hypothetical protein
MRALNLFVTTSRITGDFTFSDRKLSCMICDILLMCQLKIFELSVTNDMSGFVAHDLSGLLWSRMEVTDETGGDTTGEPEDAIRRGLFGMERKPVDAGGSSPDLGCK